MLHLEHPTYCALRHLAENHLGGALPFLVVFYCPDEWWFRVIPGNERARELYAHALTDPVTGDMLNDCVLSEQRFVRSLYYMRGVKLSEKDKSVIAKLSDSLPREDAA